MRSVLIERCQRRWHRRIFAFALSGAALMAPMTASAAPESPPNLVPWDLFDIQIGHADDWSPLDPSLAIRFSVAAANRGPNPLELLRIGTSGRQCVTWVASHVCRRYQEVGTFSYHAAHQHWHFDDFAQYELRALRADGTPDFDAPVVAGGQKASFCLIDYAREDLDSRPYPRYTTATCDTVLQGVSPGWADVYDHGLADQQIVIDHVPDGEYALVVRLNPLGHIIEETTADNLTFTPIRLTEGGTEVAPL